MLRALLTVFYPHPDFIIVRKYKKSIHLYFSHLYLYLIGSHQVVPHENGRAQRAPRRLLHLVLVLVLVGGRGRGSDSRSVRGGALAAAKSLGQE